MIRDPQRLRSDPLVRFSLCAASVLACSATLSGCVTSTLSEASEKPPISLELTVASAERIEVTYTLDRPAEALHFAQELGGYRTELWHSAGDRFRWVPEADGERVERRDGAPFAAVTFELPIDYRPLPKSYAPFSPFSEGSTLIHSGQFHACLSLPCDGTDAVPVIVRAPGKTIGVGGRRTDGEARFVSDKEGTNIFVGLLAPVGANGFVAIIDPGLPDDLRNHLDVSLPNSIDYFAAIYGPLSFTPELYVSIDSRPGPGGNESTQGGTLPNQIFMHFDGARARERLSAGSPYWMDWFFAHEAAHLFQQDQVGALPGDETAAWLHEGGADAMAALALVGRGEAERAYVRDRLATAATDCATGLAAQPLDRASAAGNFDLHYQCGLIFWLAADRSLRLAGRDGLHDLNRALFASARQGGPWSVTAFVERARALGVSDDIVARIDLLWRGGYRDAAAEIAALEIPAEQSLAPR